MGIYPTVSLSSARVIRSEYRDLLAQGIDPKFHRKEHLAAEKAAAANTLQKVAADWLCVKKSKVSSGHADDIWRSLALHIFPYMGQKPINSITAPSVISVLKPIEAKGSYETVKRLCQRLNEIIVFAVNTGIILGANPLSGIKDAFIAPAKIGLMLLLGLMLRLGLMLLLPPFHPFILSPFPPFRPPPYFFPITFLLFLSLDRNPNRGRKVPFFAIFPFPSRPVPSRL